VQKDPTQKVRSLYERFAQMSIRKCHGPLYPRCESIHLYREARAELLADTEGDVRWIDATDQKKA